jgi:hypothetical protein
MKDIRQRLINKKRSSTLEQIKKKNEVSLKLIDKNKLEKFERLNKMNNSSKKEESLKNKIKIHFDKLEEDRQEIEKLVDLRSIKFF